MDVCVLSFTCSAESSTPVCCGELRRWSHGGYTLLDDGEAARAEFALDLVLPFCSAGEFSYIQTHRTRNKQHFVTTTSPSFVDWHSDFGGSTCYVAKEEDEEVSQE